MCGHRGCVLLTRQRRLGNQDEEAPLSLPVRLRHHVELAIDSGLEIGFGVNGPYRVERTVGEGVSDQSTELIGSHDSNSEICLTLRFSVGHSPLAATGWVATALVQFLSAFQTLLHIHEQSRVDIVTELRGRFVVAFPCGRPLDERGASFGHRANRHPANVVAHVCL